MNRHDIALSVAGTLATMALAYLFYRRQQADQAAPVAQDVMEPDYTEQGLYASSAAYQYAAQLPSISVPEISTSSSIPDTGHAGTPSEGLISSILAQFHNDNAPSSDAGFTTIAAVDVQPVVGVSGIPVTSGDALTNARNMLGTGSNLMNTDNHAVPSPTLQAPDITHFNHIQPLQAQV